MKRRTFLKGLAVAAGACIMRIMPELAPPPEWTARDEYRDDMEKVWGFPHKPAKIKCRIVFTRHPYSIEKYERRTRGINEQL